MCAALFLSWPFTGESWVWLISCDSAEACSVEPQRSVTKCVRLDILACVSRKALPQARLIEYATQGNNPLLDVEIKDKS